ncbi:MAG: FemAB family XrtA/PEP-CTERM system-associated protein [bacterium]
MELHTLTPDAPVAAAERWDRFVAHCPEATFFHRAGWRDILVDSFGHAPHYLWAEEGGEIVGVLPLARMRSLLFGDARVSTPFCVYGGVAATTDAARAALEEAAVALGTRLGVDHVEFRNLRPRRDDWVRREGNATFRKAIEPSPEANLLAIPRRQRAEVRKGINRRLVATASNDLDLCWTLHARSVHRHGSPIVARRYFHDLARVFGRDCECFLVTHEGRVLASLLNLYDRDTVMPYYAGSSSEGRDGEVHPYLHWALMNHAAARGARVFDFGRSPVGSGGYHYKRNFGFTPEPLAYEYRLIRGKHAPDTDPRSPRYRLMVNTWKRLPLAVANLIGPWAARQIG